MKLDTRKLILAGASAAIILVAAIGLVHPARLARFLPAHANRAEPGSPAPSSSATLSPPQLNAFAFKGQGRLAVVGQGLISVLDGQTGRIITIGGRGSTRPAWSFDGEWLAYLGATGPEGTPNTLWVEGWAGTEAHQVEVPGPEDGGFSWSPTDNVLAIGGPSGVWLVPATGTPHQLSNVAVSTPVWSPDGKSLAYTVTLPYDSEHPEDRSDALYTIDINGGHPVRRLVAPQAGIWLAGAGWWPNGKGLLYWLDPGHGLSAAADGLDLYSLPLGSDNPQFLAHGLTDSDWLSLTPQGRLLMVTGSLRIVWANKSLALVNIESGQVQHLPNPTGCVAFSPSLSPDGRRIAFVAAKDLGDKVWGFNNPQDLADWVKSCTLWVEQVDGSDAHPLLPAGQGVYQPLWSRDGSHILYMRDNSLWLIGADGGGPVKICGPIAYEDPMAGAFGYYGFISYGNQIAWFQP